MLGNNADAFFTTPMRHRVVSGGNVGNQNPMPAPRDLNQSATGIVVTRANGDFLPGVGEEAPAAPAAPAVVSAPVSLMDKMKSPVGLAVLAGLALMFTPPGKAIRRRIFG